MTQCRVCLHDERSRVEVLLARGTALRYIAKKFGLSKDSLSRHRKNHMPKQLKAALLAGLPDISEIALEKLKTEEHDRLLTNLVAERARLQAVANEAEDDGDHAAVARYRGLILKSLELGAKLCGELNTGGVTIRNLTVLPQYVDLRVALMDALGPHPDARRDVAKALINFESKAIELVTAESCRS